MRRELNNCEQLGNLVFALLALFLNFLCALHALLLQNFAGEWWQRRVV